MAERVEPERKEFPQAQDMLTSLYLGWMPFFIALNRLDANLFLIGTNITELDLAIDQGVKSVITPHTHIHSGGNLGATLPDDYRAGVHHLAPVCLDP
jgi:hypothetical protein